MTVGIALFFLLGFFDASGQTRIQIKSADYSEVQNPGKNEFVRLLGNVAFVHDGALLKCDSAHYYPKENRFLGYENVSINQGDTLFLYSDFLDYTGKNKMAKAEGNVTLRDKEMTLTTDRLDFDRAAQTGFYLDGGVIVQEDKRLESLQGRYFTKTKSFKFRQDVTLVSPEYRIFTDTLDYETQTEHARYRGFSYILTQEDSIFSFRGFFDMKANISHLVQNAYVRRPTEELCGDSIYMDDNRQLGKIFGNAYTWDFENETGFTGGFADYTKNPEYLLVTQNPVSTLISEGDSILIIADTLVSAQIDGEKRRNLKGWKNAVMYKSDFQLICDSLFYSDIDSIFHFIGDPIIWNGDIQITGDSIFVTTRNQKVDSLVVLNNAFLVSIVDDTRFNQIKGRNMFGQFDQNELRKIDVIGNGETVYYPKNDEEEIIGLNRAECSNLVIYLNNKEVSGITFVTKPNATLYPLDQTPAGEEKLKNFRNEFHRRPKSKNDLLK